MAKIVVDLTDAQLTRARAAVSKHLDLMTEGVREVKAEPAVLDEKGNIVTPAVEAVAEVKPVPRIAVDAELEAFLIEHLRQITVMIEKQVAVVDTF